MMNLAVDIGSFLASQGYGTMNVDIFGYEKPDDPDNIILVLPNTGTPIENMRNEGIQLIIRNSNSLTCETKANEIYNYLITQKRVNLDNFFVYKFKPTSELIHLGFDKKHRYEISMNFNLKRRNK